MSVGREVATGLYNPHTMTGDIVVDGIQTSTYTAAIAPTLAHLALWSVSTAACMTHPTQARAHAVRARLRRAQRCV